MSEFDLIVFSIAFIIVGIVYSTVITFLVLFIESIGSVLNDIRVRLAIGFVLAVITIFFWEDLLGVLYNFLPVIVIIGGTVAVGLVIVNFYIWYQDKLKEYFIPKWEEEEEQRVEREMEKRIKKWRESEQR